MAGDGLMSPTAYADELLRAVGDRLDGSPLVLTLDIDGTISPIAPTPEQAIVPIETRDAIRRLVRMPDVHVALVTGRSVSDARRMIMVEGAWILGNHGLEISGPNVPLTAAPAAQPYVETMAKARAMLAPLIRATPGAFIEDKRLTLSVHYRLARPDQALALVALAHDVARVLGLRATDGRRVVDLRPLVDIDKGTAVLDLADRVGALLDTASLLYAGDDSTDEDAFVALSTRAPRAVTVRVEAEEDEQPADTAAEFRIAGSGEVGRLLRLLLERKEALR
jgi:trehalose-phosphatase